MGLYPSGQISVCSESTSGGLTGESLRILFMITMSGLKYNYILVRDKRGAEKAILTPVEKKSG